MGRMPELVNYHWLIETNNYAFAGCGYGFSNGSGRRAPASPWPARPQLFLPCVRRNRSIFSATRAAVPAASPVIGPGFGAVVKLNVKAITAVP